MIAKGISYFILRNISVWSWVSKIPNTWDRNITAKYSSRMVYQFNEGSRRCGWCLLRTLDKLCCTSQAGPGGTFSNQAIVQSPHPEHIPPSLLCSCPSPPWVCQSSCCTVPEKGRWLHRKGSKVGNPHGSRLERWDIWASFSDTNKYPRP